MTTHTDDVAARCVSYLAEHLRARPDAMSDRQRTAFKRAISYLMDVTNPLTPEEQNQRDNDVQAYVDSEAGVTAQIPDGLTDDKRPILTLLAKG